MRPDAAARTGRRCDQAALHRDGAEARLSVRRPGDVNERGARNRKPADTSQFPQAGPHHGRRRNDRGRHRLIYGFLGASQPLQPGMGAASVLLVLLCLTILVALLGGAGVSAGIALAGTRRFRAWSIVGGAVGGLVVGGFTKLLGLDAFSLLIGRSPGNITGAFEGMFIGAGVGLGALLAQRCASVRLGALVAAACGAAAGLLLSLLGGRLMLGSLDLLARQLPGSRLHLDNISQLLGEPSFGPITRGVTSALEGALFAAGVVGAMLTARREFASRGESGVDE